MKKKMSWKWFCGHGQLSSCTVRPGLAGVFDHKPSFGRAAKGPCWLAASIHLWGKQGLLCASGNQYSSYGKAVES